MSHQKLAVVEWTDAWFSSSLVTDVNLLRTTAGWLIQNNKRIVRIALTLDERGPADILSIPRAMIRKIRIIETKQLRAESTDGSDEVEPSEQELNDAGCDPRID